MRKKKVKRTYTPMSTSVLHDFGCNVLKLMNENHLIFSNPDIPLITLDRALFTLHEKIVARQSGGKQTTAEMHEARKAVVEILHIEGLFVDRIANGDQAIILCSGFTCTKDWSLPFKTVFTVEAGMNPGEIRLSCKAIKRALIYAWAISNEADPNIEDGWKIVRFSSKAKTVIKKLTSAKYVWCRFCAISVNGQGPWSNPLQQLVG